MPLCARRLRPATAATALSTSDASLFSPSAKVPSTAQTGSQEAKDLLVPQNVVIESSPEGPHVACMTSEMCFNGQDHLKGSHANEGCPSMDGSCLLSVQSPMSGLRHPRRTGSRGKVRGPSRSATPRKRHEENNRLSPMSLRHDDPTREMDATVAADAAAVREKVAEEMVEVAEACGKLYDLGGEHRERATAFLYRGCAAQVATSTAGMYGEMVESSVRQVVQYMRHYGGDEFSVFLDLGSGRGAPSCIALYQQPWLACLGIEKCPQAYSLSLETHWTVLRREMSQAELIPPPPCLPSVLSAPQRSGNEASSEKSVRDMTDAAGQASLNSEQTRQSSGALCGGRPGGRVPQRRLCFTQEDLSAFYHLEGVTHVYSFDAAMEGPLINWIVQMFMKTKTWYLYASFRSDLISKFDLKGASLVGQVSSSMWVSSEGRTTYIYVKDNWRDCKAYHRRWLCRFLFSSANEFSKTSMNGGPLSRHRRDDQWTSAAVASVQEEQNLASKLLQMTIAETFRVLYVQQEAIWNEVESWERTPSRSASPLKAEQDCGTSLRSPSAVSPSSDTKSRGRSTSRRRASCLSGASKHLQVQTLQLQAARQCCTDDKLPVCLRVEGPVWATEQEDLDENEDESKLKIKGLPLGDPEEINAAAEKNLEAKLRRTVNTFKASFVRMSKWLQPLTVLDMLRLSFLPGEGQVAWLEQRQQQLTGGGVLTRTRRPTARGFDEQERRREELERDRLLEILAKADDPAEAARCRLELDQKLEMSRRDNYTIFPYSLLQDSELSPNLLMKAREDAAVAAEALAHLLRSPSGRASSFSPIASPLSSRRHSAVASVSLRRKSPSIPASPQKKDICSPVSGVLDTAQTVSPYRSRIAPPGASVDVFPDQGIRRNCANRQQHVAPGQNAPFLGEVLHSEMPGFESTPPRSHSRRVSPYKAMADCRRKSEMPLNSSLREDKQDHTPSPPLKRRGAGSHEDKRAICDSATSRMTPKTRAAYRLMEIGFDALEIRTALSRRKRRVPEGVDG